MSHGGGRSMRDAQMKFRDTAAARELGSLARKPDRRCLTALAYHFNFAPTRVAIPSRAKRLHCGLFCGEAARVALVAWAPA